MKFAMAMLAVGGGVGAAVQAQAATIYTDTLDIPADQSVTPITLVGSTPQFDYGQSAIGYPFKGYQTTLSTDSASTSAALGLKTSTPGLPGAHEAYFLSSDTTEFKGSVEGVDGFGGPSYIHLTFSSGSTTYVGTAFIDANAELETITYEATAVPEPDAWALLIAGAALTGGAMRMARRRQSAIA